MPKFDLGVVVATPGALHALRSSGQSPGEFLCKHAHGDWGRVGGHDEKQNQVALREGGRLLSVYQTRKGDDIWVVTEADRSSTCPLLPGRYRATVRFSTGAIVS